MKPGPTMSREDSRLRVQRAADLRASGKTWQQIADSEGFRSRRAAQLAVQRFRQREHPESLSDKRRTASEGLRILKSVLFADLADAKQQGDHQAVVASARAIADVIEKDAKLNGLHAAVAQEINVRVEQTPAAIISEARERLAAVLDAEVVDLPTNSNKELTT
ncbi:hypothetical protein [Mycobacteroides salmoniphilum]|uniref:hypothetical protein n=1 Tax=Mycobacteroides salmoniphilum TaxID=404941 RepID=UPI001065CB66|nr:hypothetical protein [Mycobacteroides salmoniphilum]